MADNKNIIKYLFPAVKEYIHSPDSEDSNVERYIGSSIARLNSIAGAELNYEEDGLPRDLLFDRVRYAHSQALEVFERNFESELLSLHVEVQAPAYAESQEVPSDEDQDSD